MFKRIFLTRNVAAWDRVLRAVPAALALWAWQQGLMVGGVAVALGVVSAMLLVTSLTGTCSIYGLLGVSTRKAPPAPRN